MSEMQTGHINGFMKGVSRHRSVLLFFSLLASLAFLFGCEEKKMADPEGMLETRAEAYWKKRLLEKDYKATYEMEAEKDRLPYTEYGNRIYNAGQLSYVGIAVEKVTINDDQGEVKIKVKTNFPGIPKPVEMAIPLDHWIIEKNQWKHVLTDKRNMLNKK
jgi:hypothetical protein